MPSGSTVNARPVRLGLIGAGRKRRVACGIVARRPPLTPTSWWPPEREGRFCEKPMALSLEDACRASAAADAAELALQVGFNRGFASGLIAARRAISEGAISTPQLMRSITRDPAPGKPGHSVCLDDLPAHAHP